MQRWNKIYRFGTICIGLAALNIGLSLHVSLDPAFRDQFFSDGMMFLFLSMALFVVGGEIEKLRKQVSGETVAETRQSFVATLISFIVGFGIAWWAFRVFNSN